MKTAFTHLSLLSITNIQQSNKALRSMDQCEVDNERKYCLLICLLGVSQRTEPVSVAQTSRHDLNILSTFRLFLNCLQQFLTSETIFGIKTRQARSIYIVNNPRSPFIQRILLVCRPFCVTLRTPRVGHNQMCAILRLINLLISISEPRISRSNWVLY